MVWDLFGRDACGLQASGLCRDGEMPSRDPPGRQPVSLRCGGVVCGQIGHLGGQSGTRAWARSAANHAAMGRIAGTSDMERGFLAPSAGARMRRSNDWPRDCRPFFRGSGAPDAGPPPKRRITRPLPPRPAGVRAGALSGWVPKAPDSGACYCLCPLCGDPLGIGCRRRGSTSRRRAGGERRRRRGFRACGMSRQRRRGRRGRGRPFGF